VRTLLQDLRYALRQMRRAPAFTAVAVLTLALGIGADTAIWSVLDSVLLSPLRYRDPGRLVAVYSAFPGQGFDHFWVSPPEYLEYRQWSRSLADVGAYVPYAFNVAGTTAPVRVRSAYATASLFSTLGVAAARGHVITPRQDLPNSEPVVLLSDGLWHRAFGGDPRIVGRRVMVDGTPSTVAGVMPPGFDVADLHVDVWAPLGLGPLDPKRRGSHFLYLVGRLRPGVGLPAARAELASLVRDWRSRSGGARHAPNPEDHPFAMRPLLDEQVGAVRAKLELLAGAVGLVLLIACANVANLLLARSESRQREVAVRAALGASGARLMRQLLTESVLLSLLGGALGLALAAAGVRALATAHADSIPRGAEIAIEPRTLAFTLAVALLTGLLFGFAPALHARGRAFAAGLREGGRRATAGGGRQPRQRLRSALVVAELALAALLVSGAGLLLKSFWELSRVDPGFDPAGVLSFTLALPQPTYPKPPQAAAFYDRLVARLAVLPGVTGAAAASGLPPKRQVDANDLDFATVPRDPKGHWQNVDYWQVVTPDYFRTLRVPLVAGRTFTAGDGAGRPGVVVINETMARTFWPHRSPLGDRVRVPGNPWLTIVGVVHDVKQGGMDEKTGTELYFPSAQMTEESGQTYRSRYLVVRASSGALAELAAAVRREVRALDPALPVDQVRPLAEVVEASMGQTRLVLRLVLLFAAIALALAAIGTYGVLAYAVAQRRQEIGVRMALGAGPARVLALVLRQGLGLAAAGLALGVVLTLALQRMFAALLFHVAPSDPWALAGVVLVLATVALVASGLPAARAARVAPAIALREG
jgi:predicted permease